MKRGMFASVVLVVVAGAVSAGIVLAQLGDTQTASGTINAITTSADLYICEPDSTPGPACGSDDNGADEAVFETLENIVPGVEPQWDIRLKNVGTVDWIVSGIMFSAVITADPGNDCPANALRVTHPGVKILGKAGDSVNDNPDPLPGLIQVPQENGKCKNTVIGPYDQNSSNLSCSGCSQNSEILPPRTCQT